MEQMCRHGGCSGLAMSTGYTQAFARMCNRSQYLSAFLYLESVVAEVNQFFVFLWDGGGEYDERTFLVFTSFRNQIHIFFVMYLRAFGNQSFSQWSGSTVISGYYLAFEEEVAYKGTHTDTAGTYEID